MTRVHLDWSSLCFIPLIDRRVIARDAPGRPPAAAASPVSADGLKLSTWIFWPTWRTWRIREVDMVNRRTWPRPGARRIAEGHALYGCRGRDPGRESRWRSSSHVLLCRFGALSVFCSRFENLHRHLFCSRFSKICGSKCHHSEQVCAVRIILNPRIPRCCL